MVGVIPKSHYSFRSVNFETWMTSAKWRGLNRLPLKASFSSTAQCVTEPAGLPPRVQESKIPGHFRVEGGGGGIRARWTPLTLSMLLPKAAVAETPEVDIPHSNPFQMDNTIQIPNDTKRFFETAAVEMKYWCGITFPYLPFITTIPFISSISK